jgi:hypothetical protein
LPPDRGHCRRATPIGFAGVIDFLMQEDGWRRVPEQDCIYEVVLIGLAPDTSPLILRFEIE